MGWARRFDGAGLWALAWVAVGLGVLAGVAWPDGPGAGSAPPAPAAPGPQPKALEAPKEATGWEEVFALDAPGPFRVRVAPAKQTSKDRVEMAPIVLEALRWLQAHQSPDGRWEARGHVAYCNGEPYASVPRNEPGRADHDVGVTGLAVCAFLSAGYTHRGEHEFAAPVQRGLVYLASVQDAEGCIGPRRIQHYIYSHLTASLAVIEAYGVTGAPKLKGTAQRAVDFILLAQNDLHGWRYGVKPGDNDTSVTVWAALALNSARLTNAADRAANRPESLPFDESRLDGVRRWLDKMTDPDYGRVGYVTRGSEPGRLLNGARDAFPPERSESLTAASLLVRVFLGEPLKSLVVTRGADLIRKLPPDWDPDTGTIDMYYWHFGSLAAYQVGGETWKQWEKAIRVRLTAQQVVEGSYCDRKGSWDPIDAWSSEGGRVYATAMMALTCQAAWRYAKVAPTKK